VLIGLLLGETSARMGLELGVKYAVTYMM